ncbi:hypothetical protein Hanom_Chr02g00144021 [Helianthus anomalus]
MLVVHHPKPVHPLRNSCALDFSQVCLISWLQFGFLVDQLHQHKQQLLAVTWPLHLCFT